MALEEDQIDYSVTDAETDMPTPADKAREQMEKLGLATPELTKEERADVVPGFARGASTSLLMGVADTFDIGKATTSWMSDDVLAFNPTAKGLRDSFEFLSDKYGREETTKLIKDVTGIELKDTPSERFGELLGLPVSGLINKMAHGVTKNVDIKGSVDTLRQYYERASRGDDFDGMAPAMQGIVDKQTTASRKANQILKPRDLPDTSVSPTMVGVNSEAGRKAIEYHKELESTATDAGMDAGELFKATGVYIGRDGKYRYELDTTDAKINEDYVYTQRDGRQHNGLYELAENEYIRDELTLGDILDFEKLYKEYPDLADLDIKLVTSDDYNGAFYPISKKIELDTDLLSNPDAFMSTLLHEVQHAVQHAEGFADGSNVTMFVERAAKELGMPSVRKTSDLVREAKILNEKIQDADVEFNQKMGYGDERAGPENLANIFLSRFILGGMKDVKPYQFLTIKDPKYYDIDAVDLSDFLNNDDDFVQFDPKLQELISAQIFDVVNKFDARTMSELYGDIIRLRKERQAISDIEGRATLNYYRTYGELESRVVEDRYARVKRLKEAGHSHEDILDILRESYPPADFTIGQDILRQADPEMQNVAKSFLTSGPVRRERPSRQSDRDVTIDEGLSLANPDEYAKNVPSSYRSESPKAAVKETSEQIPVMPVNQDNLEKRGFEYQAGGRYINPKTKEDLTGKKVGNANIKIVPSMGVQGGRPMAAFNVSDLDVDKVGSIGKGKTQVKVNLVKPTTKGNKAGWSWVNVEDEELKDINTLVSVLKVVDGKSEHFYTLETDFSKGAELKTYPSNPSEPRLRPTVVGDIELQEPVGTIKLRDREHPVYRKITTYAGGGLAKKKAE